MEIRFLRICLLLAMIVMTGCAKTAGFASDEPPNAVGEVEGKQIELIKGSYQWKHTIADAPSPGLRRKTEFRTDDTFLLPSEPGVYVLAVWGEWSGDDRSNYAAAIEVRE